MIDAFFFFSQPVRTSFQKVCCDVEGKIFKETNRLTLRNKVEARETSPAILPGLQPRSWYDPAGHFQNRLTTTGRRLVEVMTYSLCLETFLSLRCYPGEQMEIHHMVTTSKVG